MGGGGRWRVRGVRREVRGCAARFGGPSEAAPIGQLENDKAGARERLRGLTVCNGLPIRKA